MISRLHDAVLLINPVYLPWKLGFASLLLGSELAELLCGWLADRNANDSLVSLGWPVSSQGSNSC